MLSGRTDLLKKITFRMIKMLWALVATSIVLLAVVISILKYSLPYADDYKSDIESYLLTNFGANISIGAIGASWQTSGPVFILNDLQLKPSKQAPLDISIKETRVKVDFWQSVLQQRFVSESFLLDGINSKINSEVFYKVSPNSDGSQLFESLSHLFLSQLQTFSIFDSSVKVRHKDGRTQDYQIDSLQWFNQGNRHRAEGDVYVDGFSKNSISILVDLYGQRRENIFGQIFFEANKMDVSPWLSQLIDKHVTLSSTEANFKAWAQVKDGLVDDVIVDVAQSGIRWPYGDTEKYLGIKSAQLQWWKSDNDWLLFANRIKLNTEEKEFSEFHFSLNSTLGTTQLDIGKVDLASLSSLSSIFSATKEYSSLAEISLSGEITQLKLFWDQQAQMSAFAEVKDFSYLPKEQKNRAYFGLQGIDLSANWHSEQLWLELRDNNGVFATKETFSQPFKYQDLALDVHLMSIGDNLSISFPQFIIKNSEVDIKLAGQFITSEQPFLSLYGEVKGPSQGAIHQYLPRYLLSDDTFSFLNDAIQQGRGELTQIAIGGDPTQLMEQKHSQFIIDAQLKETLFKFDQSWPAVENLDGRLLIDGSLLTVKGETGQFAGIGINNDVQASISLDAEQTILHLLLTPEQMQFEQFHSLVRNTPLKDPIGEVFEFVKLSGDAAATVNITVPISGETEVNVRGSVITNSASLNLDSIGLSFEELDSLITFNNDVFSVNAQSGTLFQLPVSFDVKGYQGQGGYQIESQLLAEWEHKLLVEKYPSQINDYFSGNATSLANVRVNIDDDSDEFQYFVDVTADLTNAEYKITQPLWKELGHSSSLNYSLIGDQDGNQMEANLDNKLFFQGEIPSESGVFKRANLHIGHDFGLLPESGFDISLELEKTQFEPILGFVIDLIETINSIEDTDPQAPAILSSPHHIAGNIQNLSILGLQWNNVSLDAKPQPKNWLFSVGAKETLMDITVDDDLSKGIEITADFLQIETQDYLTELDLIEQGKSEEEIEQQLKNDDVQPTMSDSDDLIRSLPPLAVVCEICQFNGKPLGKLQLNTHSEGPELIIDQATLDYKRNHASFTGKWIGDSGAGRTFVEGEITSRYFGDWLKEYELDTGIRESDAKLNLQIGWTTAPHLFNFADLSGTMDFKLGEGSLSEISDQGARIFSLFSLDSLYRKLKFDFNDVFDSGLFYNDIKGNLSIKNGVAYTDNTVMDGVAGDMKLVGQTNLNNQTLNYDVSFKPNVMSSLPMIAAYTVGLANPLAWVGLFIFDKALEDVDVISEIKLNVTGDLNNPKVEEVKRFTKRVTLTEEEKQKLKELGTKHSQKEEQEEQKNDN